jgi:GNAT superfamily N-acetyltransferase
MTSTGVPSAASPLSAIAFGTHDCPPGTIASVVTYLDMPRRPPPRPVPPLPSPPRLEAIGTQVDRYLRLYRRLGERWVWFSRVEMARDALASLIGDPAVMALALVVDGADRGLLELDFRTPGEAEIVFFGLVEEALGAGYGRWLMEEALDLAWGRPVGRLWLHTCSFDHPGALAFYRRSGFTPRRLAVELAQDPRATGLYPRDAFPDLPPASA